MDDGVGVGVDDAGEEASDFPRRADAKHFLLLLLSRAQRDAEEVSPTPNREQRRWSGARRQGRRGIGAAGGCRRKPGCDGIVADVDVEAAMPRPGETRETIVVVADARIRTEEARDKKHIRCRRKCDERKAGGTGNKNREKNSKKCEGKKGVFFLATKKRTSSFFVVRQKKKQCSASDHLSPSHHSLVASSLSTAAPAGHPSPLLPPPPPSSPWLLPRETPRKSQKRQTRRRCSMVARAPRNSARSASALALGRNRFFFLDFDREGRTMFFLKNVLW